jgi:hypothetical protein
LFQATGGVPLLAGVPALVPGAVPVLVEAIELPVLVAVVFCAVGVLLTALTLFLQPQHSQPASVMPAATTPAQAKRFFRPIEFPLRKKGVRPPSHVRSEPPAAVAVLFVDTFPSKKRCGLYGEMPMRQAQKEGILC